MQPSKEVLQEINEKNLNLIESQQFYMLGINIFKVLSYELIQLINNNSLKALLDDSESKDKNE